MVCLCACECVCVRVCCLRGCPLIRAARSRGANRQSLHWWLNLAAARSLARTALSWPLHALPSATGRQGCQAAGYRDHCQQHAHTLGMGSKGTVPNFPPTTKAALLSWALGSQRRKVVRDRHARPVRPPMMCLPPQTRRSTGSAQRAALALTRAHESDHGQAWARSSGQQRLERDTV